MKLLTRKLGIWMMIIGVVFQFLNFVTYTYFGIDIDIMGLLIFVAGLVIMTVFWKEK